MARIKTVMPGSDSYIEGFTHRKPTFAVYVGAPNDVSGNPRRGWAIYNREGYFLAFYDEGYSGNTDSVLHKMCGHVIPVTGRIDITLAQYREFMNGCRYTPIPSYEE